MRGAFTTGSRRTAKDFFARCRQLPRFFCCCVLAKLQSAVTGPPKTNRTVARPPCPFRPPKPKASQRLPRIQRFGERVHRRTNPVLGYVTATYFRFPQRTPISCRRRAFLVHAKVKLPRADCGGLRSFLGKSRGIKAALIPKSGTGCHRRLVPRSSWKIRTFKCQLIGRK